jgi:Tannase and feruloyl esterase
MRRASTRVLGAMAAAAAIAWTGVAAAADEADCVGLKNLSLADVRIDVADNIVPNPEWAFPPSSFNRGSASATKPFCRVAGFIEQEIGFEVWLPVDWNGRLQNVGNGGYAGAFNYPAANEAMAAGYASATTDVGHRDEPGAGLGASWAENRPDRVENFGHRAHHLLAVVSKAIVESYYGRPEEYAYYTGCSSGGWQGLMEIQKYPTDYDAIAIGAPAQNFVRKETISMWLARQVPEEGSLTQELAEKISDAARSYCDLKDGVEDGIVSMPLQCDFDPARLACDANSGGDSCLLPAQVHAARLAYGLRTSAGGLALYPGVTYGASIRAIQGGGTGQPGPLLRYLESDYEWSAETFDADRDIPALEARYDDMLGATNPDLRAFADNGGKMILWHGWTDPGIPALNTVGYMQTVEDEMGADSVDSFVRVYMAPGVNHCGGGVGPNQWDMLTPLVRWREDGVAPGSIIASSVDADGEVTRTRPLCPFPQVARYDGQGDPDDAASFSCVEP